MQENTKLEMINTRIDSVGEQDIVIERPSFIFMAIIVKYISIANFDVSFISDTTFIYKPITAGHCCLDIN